MDGLTFGKDGDLGTEVSRTEDDRGVEAGANASLLSSVDVDGEGGDEVYLTELDFCVEYGTCVSSTSSMVWRDGVSVSKGGCRVEDGICESLL